MRPPATWKSETVIPSARKIILPRKMKPTETARLVTSASVPSSCRRFASAFPPSPRKIAISPMGSIATKSGMKARRNFSR
jgi:hypothetical protein